MIVAALPLVLAIVIGSGVAIKEVAAPQAEQEVVQTVEQESIQKTESLAVNHVE